MKLYELIISVNFIVVIIYLFSKRKELSKQSDSFPKVFYFLFSFAFFIATLLFWLESNVNFDFLNKTIF